MENASKEPTSTFEKVWATLDRLSQQQEKASEESRKLSEQMQETDRKLREMSAETDRQMQETDRKLREMSAETDRQMQETDRKLREVGAHIEEVGANLDRGAKQMREEIGGIGNSNGFMAEDMFFNAFNKTKKYAKRQFYEVEARVSKSISNGKANEIDILMYNGDTVAIIEAKYRARENAIEQVLAKATNFRSLFPQYMDYKIILGLAGMSFEEGVAEKAKELGIGVVKFIGDAAEFHTDNIKEY